MQLSPKHFDQVLSDFRKSWNIERIREMDILEYADLSNPDSLCYWLEYGTKQLGAIGRISLNKFELWKSKNGKEFKDSRYRQGRGYAWNSLKGDDVDTAFNNIRRLAVEIVEQSQNQNWKAIDDIHFHAIGKWKLAFLFSEKRLLPVYSKRALLAIGNGLGCNLKYNDAISFMQHEIISRKPEEEDIVDFSYRTYTQFASRATVHAPSYFIVGSKYGNNRVMDQFIQHSCIGIGWLDSLDFEPHMGQSRKSVYDVVKANYTDSSPPLNIIQRYFAMFSKISAGDIIAVKSKGSFGTLSIIAYAQVVERNGSVYFHDENLLGHHIHVEFLDAGFVKTIEANYAGTIHELRHDKDGDTFSAVFGWYSQYEAAGDESNMDVDTPVIEEVEDPDGQYEQEGYNEKIETPFERSAIARVIVNRIHNRIQNQFIKYLNETYPDDTCSGEKRYVDAKRISKEEVFLYEIKPFVSVYQCIRDGIGQLLGYLYKETTSKRKNIVIVGPSKPDRIDRIFIEEMKNMLNVPFYYLAFDEAELSAVIY